MGCCSEHISMRRPGICNGAPSGGYLGVLQWSHLQGCECGPLCGATSQCCSTLGQRVVLSDAAYTMQQSYLMGCTGQDISSCPALVASLEPFADLN